MRKDRILITGGSGFIGTNLVQYFLDKNLTLINVDIRQPLNFAHDKFWVQGDILDEGLLERLFFDYPNSCIHCLYERSYQYPTDDIRSFLPWSGVSIYGSWDGRDKVIPPWLFRRPWDKTTSSL